MDRVTRYDYDNNVAQILQACFGIKVFWTKTLADGKYCHTYLLVGTELDITIARSAIPIFIKAMTGGVARLLRQLGEAQGLTRKVKWTANVGRNYYDGLTTGYIQANAEGRRRAYDSAHRGDADAYAVVLVDKDKAINLYVEKKIPTKDVRYNADYGENGTAFARGVADGSRLETSVKLGDGKGE